MKNTLRTLWVVLLALVLGFAVQAQQRYNNLTVLTNLQVGQTLNGYDINGLLTNNAASKIAITNGTAVNLAGSLTNVTVDGAALLRIPGFTPQAVAIDSPVAYQVIQRSTTTNGSIAITAQASGPTGTTVEARFNGGSWTTLGTTTEFGEVTGSITGSVGTGNLDIRTASGLDVVTVSNVSVGDVLAIWGQSNGSGRGQSNQSFTNTATLGAMLGNDYEWKLLADPTDSDEGQIDTVSSDSSGTGMGSVWPLVGDLVINSSGVPIGFVPCALGGSGITDWAPGTNRFDRSTLFGSALYRTRESGARAVLWWQGEAGCANPSDYTTPFQTMASAASTEIPGLKFIVAKIQENTGIAANRQTNQWLAVENLWSANTNVLRGPTLADVPFGAADNILAEDEGSAIWVHLRTSTNIARAAARWATNIVAHFP